MAEVRQMKIRGVERIEVFVTAEELCQALKQQGVEDVKLANEEYCLTFDNKEEN